MAQQLVPADADDFTGYLYITFDIYTVISCLTHLSTIKNTYLIQHLDDCFVSNVNITDWPDIKLSSCILFMLVSYMEIYIQ